MNRNEAARNLIPILCLLLTGGCLQGGTIQLPPRLKLSSSGGMASPTPTAPAPTSFAAVPISPTEIRLSWIKPSLPPSGFNLYRATGNGSFAKIATPGPNALSHSDSSLSPSTGYRYKIEAVYSSAVSASAGPISSMTPGGPPPATAPERGAWVWRKTNWVGNAAERSALFNFAIQNSFSVLYVDVASDFPGNLANLKIFVEAGAALNLKFRFLFGSSGAVPNAQAVNFLANTSQFKNTLSPAGQAALQGVQYDIETYIHGQASELAPIAIAVRSAQQTLYPNVELDFCIPRWLDGEPPYNGRRLSDVIQDNSDRVTLMDYVDNPSVIISDAATEVSYASTTGKKVVVGVETLCTVGEGETFCQEGRAVLESALTLVTDHFHLSPGFGGHAIHYYESLIELPP